MESLKLLLSFAQITFPVLLLVPPLITSFRHFTIPPVDLAKFFVVLLADYGIIVLAALLSAINQRAWVALGILVVSAFLAAIALWYVMKWTVHELVDITVDIRPRE